MQKFWKGSFMITIIQVKNQAFPCAIAYWLHLWKQIYMKDFISLIIG